MASQHNKLSRKRKVFPFKVFPFKVFPMKNGGIDTSIDTDETDTDYNALDTLESINQEFDRNTANEIPKNNSWVNYEDRHDVEGFYTNSDLNFQGFNWKEVADVKQYKDKFIKYNMLQNVEDKEHIELKNYVDSDLDIDLDFDLDFSGFNSNEDGKLKDYKDKFINMLKNSEKEEHLDLNFEDYIDNFSDFLDFIPKPLEDSDEKKAVEVEGNQVEDIENSGVVDFDSRDLDVPPCNSWGHTFSYWRESGGMKHFRCIKPDCPSFIIVYEDNEVNENEAEREYLFSVKECQYHK